MQPPPTAPASVAPSAAPVRSKKGTWALILGITALVLICVPFLSIPLGVTGVVLGVMAVVAANKSPEKRLGVPVTGLVLSAIAALGSLIMVPVLIGIMLPGLSAARDTAREVKSHGTDAESAALWTAHDQACVVGDVSMTIAEIEADEDWISFTMHVKNKGTQAIECTSLRGDVEGSAKRQARLTRNDYGRLEPMDWELDGATPNYIPQDGALDLNPGETATDMLMFSGTNGREQFLDLEIPGRAVGESEPFRFRIPASAWRGGTP